MIENKYAISFQERAGKPGGGKGILIQEERTGALSTLNNQSVYCIEGHVVDRNTGQNGLGVKEDVSQTLNATDRHAVYSMDVGMLQAHEEVSPPELARQYKDPPIVSFAAAGHGGYKEGVGTLRANGGDLGGGSETFLEKNNVVRRLTPLECERLQGYPDNWTLIGEPKEVDVTDYKITYDEFGEEVEKEPIGTHKETMYFYTDSNGKKKKCSDSARYKALGNSIALPFWFYLLRRISAQYERPATLGSLFDGIGGFPLCWERCNGKGTALWASEIEEFPIAVTKIRFPEE